MVSLFAHGFTCRDQLIHFLLASVYPPVMDINDPSTQRSAHRRLCREIGCPWSHSKSCLTMPGRSFVVYQPVTPEHAAAQYLSPGSLFLLLFSVGAPLGVIDKYVQSTEAEDSL